MKKTGAFLVAVMLTLPVWAVYHKIGEFTWGQYPKSIEVVNNIAYVGNDISGLQIGDVSDSQNPVWLSEYNPSCYITNYTVEVDTTAHLAYLTGSDSLLIIDVSDLQHPQKVSSLLLPGCASCLQVVNHIAYIAHGDGMAIIDVTDPHHPTELADYPVSNAFCYYLAISGNTAFLSGEELGLQIVDVSNPQNPHLISTVTDDDAAGMVAVQGTMAYIGSLHGLIMVDISDLSAPQIVGHLAPTKNLSQVKLQQDKLYAGWEYGLLVFDLTDPQAPQAMGEYCNSSGIISFSVDSSRLYMIRRASVEIIDLENPQNPILSGEYDTNCAVWNLAMQGNITYAAAENGLWVFDTHDLTNPQFLGFLSTQDVACNIALRDSLAFVSCSKAGLQVISIADPYQPRLVATFTANEPICFCALYGDYAYYSCNSGLDILNISDLNDIHSVGWLPLGCNPKDYAIEGSTLYLVKGSSMCIFDLTDPTSPQLLGEYRDLPAWAFSIAVKNHVAYIADTNSGLLVFDVSNPASPNCVATFRTHSTSSIDYCYLNGDQLISCDSWWNEMLVYDIHDPLQPVQTNCFGWDRQTRAILGVGNQMVLADDGAGLDIIDPQTLGADDPTIPATSALHAMNYPNPFNPTTTIAYSLPAAGKVTLSVYNLRGQLVKRLVDEQQVAGAHNVLWNGTDDNGQGVASGIYFYRLETGNRSIVKKMVMMK